MRTSCAASCLASPGPTPWGWKMAHRLLNREGWSINKKQTQRLWHKEGFAQASQVSFGSSRTPGTIPKLT